jgi:hypothetical protein
MADKQTAQIKNRDSTKSAIRIYGRSDDLIYVEGALHKEIGANWDKPTYLVFDNGVLVKAKYDETGKWRIYQLTNHAQSFRYSPGECTEAPVDYTEVVDIEAEKEFTKVFVIQKMKEAR